VRAAPFPSVNFRPDHIVVEALNQAALAEPAVLAQLHESSRHTGQSVSSLALSARLLTRGELLEALGRYLGCGWVEMTPERAPAELVGLLPAGFARRHGVVPWRREDSHVAVLARDPCDPGLAGRVAFLIGQPVRLVIADPAGVAGLVQRHYGGETGPVETGIGGGVGESREPAREELAVLAAQRKVVDLVDRILHQAIEERASDLHFEPFAEALKVRLRVDGTLREIETLPGALALPIISRIKVLADLDIAERRTPQDGRIHHRHAGSAIDLRVSVLPTQFGESVVLRVLDQSSIGLDLGELGLPAQMRAGLEERLARPCGILIVTGPTGSGKTTTLYAGLRRLNDGECKILTVEDPVEYEIDGIMQVPVNLPAGLTFASALRAFLRQDPDTIMVGEIRDAETAQIAIQASLTGHLVLTTLHTPDAMGAVTRLVDMGVEPFLLGATLEGVLAQRLVRRLCPDCRRESVSLDGALAGEWAPVAGAALTAGWRASGCPACRGSGHRGRVGIFEWAPVFPELREAISAGAPAQVLRRILREAGWRSLRDEAWRLVCAGEISLEEAMRFV